MFIVWIKYFSWPSLCCSVFYFIFPPPLDTPKHIHFPSLFLEALWHKEEISSEKQRGTEREQVWLMFRKFFEMFLCPEPP